MMKPPSQATKPADHPGETGPPRLGAGPHRGHRRGGVSGSCLMEYVSIFAGEPFSDLPACTHPAIAVVAWRVNDELPAATRQQLLSRAPALVGAGRGLHRPVRSIVLGVIADAALALEPDHRYFRRLRRRLDRAPVTAGKNTGGRLSTLSRHVVPIDLAMTRFLRVVSCHSAHREQREQHMIDLLDACLAAVDCQITNLASALTA
jgi:hypothetical protein